MKTIHKAVVLHEGWESDNLLWVVEHDNGKREIRTTSHGAEYTADIEELDEKIKETQSSLNALIRARELITE